MRLDWGFGEAYALYSREFGILTQRVIETVRYPDIGEEVKFHGESSALFLMKYFGGKKGNPFYLVYGPKEGTKFSVGRAIKFYADICGDIKGKRPTEFLYQFAQTFGFQVRIGNAIDRFFFHHTLIREPDDKRGPDVLVTPSSARYLFESIFFQTKVEGVMRIEYSFAYALNVDKYVQYAREHDPDPWKP